MNPRIIRQYDVMVVITRALQEQPGLSKAFVRPKLASGIRAN
jgi:hypothetical protein